MAEVAKYFHATTKLQAFWARSLRKLGVWTDTYRKRKIKKHLFNLNELVNNNYIIKHSTSRDYG